MSNKNVLTNVLEKIKPSESEIKEIGFLVQENLNQIKKKINSLNIKVDIFLGGSFAKNTFIKKDVYDVDVFLRFDKKYSEKDFANLMKKILYGFKNVSVIHGSRDYFRIKLRKDLFIELVPVLKISKPNELNNITDLSYSHVKYINKKIKDKKVLDEIRLAKAFCYANKCYGAESYVRGFSGYSLELLIYHYKSFVKFLKAMSKVNEEKLILDIENFYSKKKNVLIDMNSSKLESPVILVDPTFKQRNALAALSLETFNKFKEAGKKFLNHPSEDSFEPKKIDLKKIKTQSIKSGKEFILIEIFTEKQEGDIAGSKLLKFCKHLENEISKFFLVEKKGFNYNQKKSSRCFFVVKSRKEIIFSGPFLEDKKNVKKFKKEHKKVFTKSNKIYALEKIDFSLRDFVKKWKLKNKRRIKEMYIKDFKVLDVI